MESTDKVTLDSAKYVLACAELSDHTLEIMRIAKIVETGSLEGLGIGEVVKKFDAAHFALANFNIATAGCSEIELDSETKLLILETPAELRKQLARIEEFVEGAEETLVK